MSDGHVDAARQLGVKLLRSDHSKEVVRIFSGLPMSEVCAKCGSKREVVFIQPLLKYVQCRCGECLVRAQGEKARIEAKALDGFLRNKKHYVSLIMSKLSIPELFVNASMGDIGKGLHDVIRPGSNLYVFGNVGVGKSYLATALTRRFVENLPVEKNGNTMGFVGHGWPEFAVVSELLLEIRSTFDMNCVDRELDVIDKYSNAGLLVLDDMGAEKTTEWALQTLYVIINRRINNLKQTIITSNLSLDDLSFKLSDRIASRIKGMCGDNIIRIEGDDRRNAVCTAE